MEPRKVGELWIIWKNAFKYSVKEEKAASRDVMDLIRHLINDEIELAHAKSPEDATYQDVRRDVLEGFAIPKADWQDFSTIIAVVQGGRNDMKREDTDKPGRSG